MANASKIVSDYQQALGKGDFAAARKLVHDNLLFQGPIDTFHSPEPYFEALKKLHPIIPSSSNVPSSSPTERPRFTRTTL